MILIFQRGDKDFFADSVARVGPQPQRRGTGVSSAWSRIANWRCQGERHDWQLWRSFAASFSYLRAHSLTGSRGDSTAYLSGSWYRHFSRVVHRRPGVAS